MHRDERLLLKWVESEKKRRKNTETNKTQMENKDTLYIPICMYIEPQEFLAGFHLLNTLHRHDVIIN